MTAEELKTIITPENTIFVIDYKGGIYTEGKMLKYKNIKMSEFDDIINAVVNFSQTNRGAIELYIGDISKEGKIHNNIESKYNIQFIIGVNYEKTGLARFVQRTDNKPIAEIRGYEIDGEKYLFMYDYKSHQIFLSLNREDEEIAFCGGPTEENDELYFFSSVDLSKNLPTIKAFRSKNTTGLPQIIEAFRTKKISNKRYTKDIYEVKEIFCEK